MAKKVTTDQEAESTSPVLIKAEFKTPAIFKLPNKAESLAIIKKKKDEYALLKIADVNDKAGYDAVVAAMGEMKKTRLAFVGSAKENVIDPMKKAIKDYETDLDDVANGLKEVEDALRKQKDFIDDEKKRLKNEAELEKLRVMQLRINDLNLLGAAFDGKMYSFPYNDMLLITTTSIKDMDVEQFDAFLANVKTSWDAHQLQIKETAERKEREAKELLEKQQEVNQQAEDLKVRATAVRVRELKTFGAVKIDGGYALPNHGGDYISDEDVANLDDNAWDGKVNEWDNYVVPVVEEIAAEPEPTLPAEPEQVIENQEAPEENSLPPVVITELRHGGDDRCYTDSDITTKMVMRVYPDEFAEISLAGVEVINKGKAQGLNWAIFKK